MPNTHACTPTHPPTHTHCMNVIASHVCIHGLNLTLTFMWQALQVIILLKELQPVSYPLWLLTQQASLTPLTLHMAMFTCSLTVSTKVKLLRLKRFKDKTAGLWAVCWQNKQKRNKKEKEIKKRNWIYQPRHLILKNTAPAVELGIRKTSERQMLEWRLSDRMPWGLQSV